MTSLPQSPDKYSACLRAKVWAINPPTSIEPDTLALTLSDTRTSISAVSIKNRRYAVSAENATPEIVRASFLGDRIILELNTSGLEFATEHPTNIEFDFVGEPPFIAHSEWDPSDRKLADYRTEFYRDPFARRRELINANSLLQRKEPRNPHPNASRLRERLFFFYLLDKLTHPTRLTESFAKASRRAINHFQTRIFERAKKSCGRPFSPNGADDDEFKDSAMTMSGIACRVFRRFFGCSAGAARLDDYFESFVSGDLSLGHSVTPEDPLQTHGAPNGSQFFSFAEAALFFSAYEDCPERKHLWSMGLPTFVRCCEILVSHYWSGGCRQWSSYGYQWRELHPFASDKRRRLRDAYDFPMDQYALEARFNSICQFAFRDQH